MEVTKTDFYEAKRQARQAIIEHVGLYIYRKHKDYFISGARMPCIFSSLRHNHTRCPFTKHELPTIFTPRGGGEHNFAYPFTNITSLVHYSTVPCTEMGSLPVVRCFAVRRRGNTWTYMVDEHPIGQCPHKPPL